MTRFANGPYPETELDEAFSLFERSEAPVFAAGAREIAFSIEQRREAHKHERAAFWVVENEERLHHAVCATTSMGPKFTMSKRSEPRRDADPRLKDRVPRP